MKEKTKDKIKSWSMALGFALVVGLCAFGCSNLDQAQKTDAYSVNSQQESVTFTKEELNNCTYSAFNDYLLEDIVELSEYFNTITYNNETYYLDDWLVWYAVVNEQTYWIKLQQGQFGYFIGESVSTTQFTNSLTMNDVYPPSISYLPKQTLLSANQLNNNTYEYFGDIVDGRNGHSVSSEYFINSYIIYNNNVYLLTDEDIGLSDNSSYLQFTNNSTNYFINFKSSDNSFELLDSTNDSTLPFTNSITIYSTYIHDNLFSPDQYVDVPMTNILVSFISLLVGGIVDLAKGVAEGVTSMATALFITGENLSVFGGIIAIFAALALAVGITTKVYTWVTSLGN